jgi:CO/xanthine dehydrogenase Mo-binding subunit
LPLQVEAGVGFYDEENKIIKLWAATQWLHDTQADIAQSLGLPKEKIRIIQPVIGGAFGKKEDISVHIHLALAAIATKRPVKLTYTREESIMLPADWQWFTKECITVPVLIM